MGLRRDSAEVAGIVGDAVMDSLDELVARLRRAETPPEVLPAAAVPAAPAPGEEPFPVGPLAELVAAVVALVVPRVMARIDPDALLDQVDVQRLVDRVDVAGLVARVDLDEVVARIDVNALVDRIDIDEVVRRIDLQAATREALEAVDIGEIVRESTATIGSDVVEGLRSQTMRADVLLAGLVDRLLGRDGGRRTALRDQDGGS
jgi:hypothetical protein